MTRRPPGVSTARHALIATDLGELTVVVADDDGEGEAVVGLYFPGHWTLPDPVSFGPREDTLPLAGATRRQLQEYLAGKRRDFDLPVRLRGGELAQRVWAVLQEVGYGERTTYGEIARRLGAAAQPVGRAVGANPVSIIVPCHRVVGSDGSLTGYAGGLERKRVLLDLEEPPAADRGALF